MQETTQKRRNRVFKSLHKPLTYMGIERTLFFMVCVTAVGTFNLFNSILAGIFVFIGGAVFGHGDLPSIQTTQWRALPSGMMCGAKTDVFPTGPWKIEAHFFDSPRKRFARGMPSARKAVIRNLLCAGRE